MTNKRKIISLAVLAVVVAISAAWGAWRWINAGFGGRESVWIYVPENMARQDLARYMDDRLGAWGRRAFRIYDFAAPEADVPRGAYRVEPGERARDFARRLRSRRQNPVRVTLNNLRKLSDVADCIDRQLELTAGDFLAACDSLLPAAGFKRPEFIAAFLPDTYEFYWTADAGQTVRRLLDYRNRFWNDERRSKARELGLTPVQVATIASIAEEETRDRQERATVSRLYLNRFSRGMKLQADPTVKFAVGDFGLRRILGKHLATPSPYNTYRNAGLPPGPIRMPESATMQALLDSRPHNWLYMCADPSLNGRHRFAADYSEHQRNAAAYRRAISRLGIR